MNTSIRSVVALLALAMVTSACSGSPSAPGAGSPGTGSTPAPAAAGGGGGGGGGGGSRGFDCAVLITPAELDQISGFKGGTIETRSRGDNNPDTPGYGECGFDEPAADTWFGSIGISTGDNVEGFDAQYDYNKAHGGVAIPGLGAEAILVDSDAGLNILAKSNDGVGINAGLATVTDETTKEKAKDALRRIVETILGRV